MSVMAVVSRTSATSKMELFMKIVKDWKLLTIVIKSPIQNVAGVLKFEIVKNGTAKYVLKSNSYCS